MLVCQLVILNMSKRRSLSCKGGYLRRNRKKGMFFEVDSDWCLIMTRDCGKCLQYKWLYETHWSLRTKKIRLESFTAGRLIVTSNYSNWISLKMSSPNVQKNQTTKYDETTKIIKYFQILTLIGSYCDEDESPFVTPRGSKETEQKQGHKKESSRIQSL